MTIPAGMRLGPYEIVGQLGAGGMGEVYRARDPRIGREVAVKVLPAGFASDPDRLRRFEQEARTTGALNHPNVLQVLDIGSHDGAPYLVAELLEGETLRKRIEARPLPPRRAVEIAEQIARGLGAAHEKGIVHRDLKPENIFITRDGRVKILDFGLAKLAGAEEASSDRTVTPSQDLRTADGVVLGTAGYMAPEQVRGRPADERSDIFAFGAILYEMLKGERAFERETGAETMTAILREEPPDLAGSGSPVPPALDRVVRHCLEKTPEQRFQSARDLAFALHAALESSGASASHPATAERPQRRRSLRLGALGAGVAVVAALGAGYLAGHRTTQGRDGGAQPTFRRLTFGRGTIRTARFAPDGKTVVYGAAWDGGPIRLFITRVDSRDSTPLSLPNAELLAVSSKGELAISLDATFSGWMGTGTLARAPLLGGAARPVLEDVREADWTPDGSDLAVVRRVDGKDRLEFPIGRVLHETPGYISHIRFSPQGDRIAFADHPIYADDVGVVAVVDLAGSRKALFTQLGALRGLAWSPDGRQVYFTYSPEGEMMALYAADLDGHLRYVLGGVSQMLLLDVARDGSMLIDGEGHHRHLEALAAGADAPRDVSLAREGTVGRFISNDGKTITVTDQNSSRLYDVYLGRSDGSPAVRLGPGDGYDLSPDGRWVLALTPESPARVLIHPIGAGQSRELPNPEGLKLDTIRWMPDGRRIVALGSSGDRPHRGYVLDTDGAPPRPFTEEAVEVPHGLIPLAPDGSRVALRDPRGGFSLYATAGGAPEPVRGLAASDLPLEFCDDGRSLFVGRREGAGWRVLKLDLETGRSAPWTEIRPAEAAGLRLSWVYVTPNGRYWIHSYSRLLSDMYAVEGLR